MHITISPVQREEIPALVALQRESFAPLYALYRDEGSPHLRGADELLRCMELPERRPYAIYADGALCGGVTAYARGGGVYYLARLYVAPALQGRGVASRAIALLEARFPDARKWTLDFPADQPANRRCYEKAGYRDTGITEQRSDRLTLATYQKEISGHPA